MRVRAWGRRHTALQRGGEVGAGPGGVRAAERLRSRGRGGGTLVRAALGSGAERGVARSGRAAEEEGRREEKKIRKRKKRKNEK